MTKNIASELVGLQLPVGRGCPFAPPTAYERLREQAPINKVSLTSGGEAWWVSGHEEGRAVLADGRFSSDKRKEGFPLFTLDAATLQQLRGQPPLMLGMDGAEHSAARRPVIGEFTVKRMAALRPRIQDIVDHFIDDMLATDQQPVDLVDTLSLPSLVICELLGVPYTDHDFFQSRTTMMVRRTSLEDRQRAFAELRAYIDDLVTHKESDPSDDLLSRQIARQRQQDTLDHAGLVSLALLLLTAGHETTANMISLGVVALPTHPRQLALLTADPDKIPMAVEELLRYFTIADGVTSRLATEDVEISGVSIKAGQGVIVSTLSANWDPAAFKDPAELDIERGTRHHLAFGFGPHQCLGQNLARMELQIVFDTLSAASPPCGSPHRPRTCRSRPTPSSTAFTNSRSPGEQDMMRIKADTDLCCLITSRHRRLRGGVWITPTGRWPARCTPPLETSSGNLRPAAATRALSPCCGISLRKRTRT